MLAAALLLAAAPGFHRDILPILERRCQACHRTGEMGPMPLESYAQVRPWARAIREAVRLRRMPPWFADPRHGRFSNDPSLRPEEIARIAAWVNAGAPEGPREAASKPGKQVPAPRMDQVLRMPQPFVLRRGSSLDYQFLIFPQKFTADRWVRQVVVRPGDRSVVHHAVLYVREAGSAWLAGEPVGIPFAPRAGRTTTADILAVYAPGSPAVDLPPGMAKKIPAGAQLVLQLHYTPRADRDTRDQTEVGLVFANAPPAHRVVTLQLANNEFVVPAGERGHRVTAMGTLPRPALLLNFFPHLHLRGAAFEFELVGEGGRQETLLRVVPYNFYWQLTYWLAAPRLLPAGARLRATATYDNSAANPRNPDPSVDVRPGEQSWQEMMIGFFDVAIAPDLDKETFFRRP